MEEPESLSITPFFTISRVSEASAVDPSVKKFTNCQPQISVSKEILEKTKYWTLKNYQPYKSIVFVV